jgi:hypothetical protein
MTNFQKALQKIEELAAEVEYERSRRRKVEQELRSKEKVSHLPRHPAAINDPMIVLDLNY